MNKVLITGGTGFLGSHIISRIIDKVDSITVATTDIRQNTTLKKLGVDLNKINLSINVIKLIISMNKNIIFLK